MKASSVMRLSLFDIIISYQKSKRITKGLHHEEYSDYRSEFRSGRSFG